MLIGILGPGGRRSFFIDTFATLLVAAGLGFLLLFLTAEAYYVGCAQKASSCSVSFYSLFGILVVGFSIAESAVACGGLALKGPGRHTAIRNISIIALAGSALTLLYGMIPTMIYGIGVETIDYGFPFTDFVQSAGNVFSPLFVVLNYLFWFGLGHFVRLLFRLRKPPRLITSLVAAAAVTAFTFEVATDVACCIETLVGRGFPFPYYREFYLSTYTTEFDPALFAADFVLWLVLTYLVLWLVNFLRTEGKQSKDPGHDGTVRAGSTFEVWNCLPSRGWFHRPSGGLNRNLLVPADIWKSVCSAEPLLSAWRLGDSQPRHRLGINPRQGQGVWVNSYRRVIRFGNHKRWLCQWALRLFHSGIVSR